MTKTHNLIAVIGAVLAGLVVLASPAQACCEDEFNWAEPDANALKAHGLQWVIDDLGIQSALAVEDACELVPSLGVVDTAKLIAEEYTLTETTAARLIVAAGDVCPEIK
jgi:hypothetical protein